jgi:hypothetical protein
VSSRSTKSAAITLGLFALAVYVGYMVWIGTQL